MNDTILAIGNMIGGYIIFRIIEHIIRNRKKFSWGNR